jgi:hypothetical protein
MAYYYRSSSCHPLFLLVHTFSFIFLSQSCYCCCWYCFLFHRQAATLFFFCCCLFLRFYYRQATTILFVLLSSSCYPLFLRYSFYYSVLFILRSYFYSTIKFFLCIKLLFIKLPSRIFTIPYSSLLQRFVTRYFANSDSLVLRF